MTATSFRRAVAPVLVAAAMAAGGAGPSVASSHREAPFIATQPQVDATDFYMFRSYEPGPRRLRHADRELPAAAGPVRRAELLQARSERRLRDPRHQRRQRRREHHVPVPVDQRPARQPAQRRRQDGVDPAGAERLRRRRPAERHRAQHRRELHADRGPRAAAQRRAASRSPTPGGATTFAKPVDYIGTKTIGNYVALREPAHPRHRDSRLHGHRPRVRRASARIRSSSTSARRSTSSTSSSRRSSSIRWPSSRPRTRWPTRTSRRSSSRCRSPA